MLDWNKSILSHKSLPSFFLVYFVECLYFWILSSSRRYPKCALEKVTRRVSKTSPKNILRSWPLVIQENLYDDSSSSSADHHQVVDLLQSATAAWDSCIFSYTHLVWLQEFCYALSSARYGPMGGLPTWRQCIHHLFQVMKTHRHHVSCPWCRLGYT